jgi:DNA-binding Lrp family transcriptional regulator
VTSLSSATTSFGIIARITQKKVRSGVQYLETPEFLNHLAGFKTKSKSYQFCDPRTSYSVVIDMVKAYILIKATVGQEDSVLREMLALSVTEEAHKVFGPYDIVAEVRGRDMETLVEIITEKVRKIKGIEDTQSILVVDSEIDMTATSLGS